MTSELTRGKGPARLPTVLGRDEVNQMFRHVDDPLMDLIVRLLYGTGMRLLGEALNKSVLDFGAPAPKDLVGAQLCCAMIARRSRAPTAFR